MTDALLPQVPATRVGLRRYGVQIHALGRYDAITGIPALVVDQPVRLSRSRFFTRWGAKRFARVFRVTTARDGTMYDAQPVMLVPAP